MPFSTLLRQALNSKLLRDNLVLFGGSFVAGVLGFFYHFYMARVLGPADYGILGTILSAFYMLNVAFTNTIQTAVSRFTTAFWVKKAAGELKYLILRSAMKLALYSVLLYGIFFLLVPFLSRFLRIEAAILYFSGVLIFFVVLVPVGRGVLQGTQLFTLLSLNLLSEGIVKFGAGVLLVWLGYRIFGAIGAIILSYAIVVLLFVFPLRRFLRVKSKPFNTSEVYAYSWPVFIMLASLTAFFSVDVILVKHFFDAVQAGYYAALSLLGKVIFFGSLSITQVMFSKASELVEQQSYHRRLFFHSLLIIGGCLLFALFLYFMVPGVLVNILFGPTFSAIVPYVGLFGLFITLYSLVYFTTFYYAALKKKMHVPILILFNIIQITLIWIFHSSFAIILSLLIGIMALLLIILFIPILFSFQRNV